MSNFVFSFKSGGKEVTELLDNVRCVADIEPNVVLEKGTANVSYVTQCMVYVYSSDDPWGCDEPYAVVRQRWLNALICKDQEEKAGTNWGVA